MDEYVPFALSPKYAARRSLASGSSTINCQLVAENFISFRNRDLYRKCTLRILTRFSRRHFWKITDYAAESYAVIAQSKFITPYEATMPSLAVSVRMIDLRHGFAFCRS
jgi:hypothetical protein